MLVEVQDGGTLAMHKPTPPPPCVSCPCLPPSPATHPGHVRLQLHNTHHLHPSRRNAPQGDVQPVPHGGLPALREWVCARRARALPRFLVNLDLQPLPGARGAACIFFPPCLPAATYLRIWCPAHGPSLCARPADPRAHPTHPMTTLFCCSCTRHRPTSRAAALASWRRLSRAA